MGVNYHMTGHWFSLGTSAIKMTNIHNMTEI